MDLFRSGAKCVARPPAVKEGLDRSVHKLDDQTRRRLHVGEAAKAVVGCCTRCSACPSGGRQPRCLGSDIVDPNPLMMHAWELTAIPDGSDGTLKQLQMLGPFARVGEPERHRLQPIAGSPDALARIRYRLGPGDAHRWSDLSHGRIEIGHANARVVELLIIEGHGRVLRTSPDEAKSDHFEQDPRGPRVSGRLAGRVALITGGASGIGEGTARRFVDEGAQVVIADMQVEAGQALAAELGDAARFAETNVTAEEQIAHAVDMAVDEFGRLDVMFNNAGIVGVIGPIAATPTEAWDNTISILLRGVFLGVKHAARVMTPQKSGSIINTSSTAGILGGLGPHAYTTAKHGVIGLTKSVANELAQYSIRVNAISPGNTVTAMTAGVSGDHTDMENITNRIESGSPLGYAGFPEDIANAALYLASDESKYMNGHTMVVDAGQTTSGMVPHRFHTGQTVQFHEAGRTS